MGWMEDLAKEQGHKSLRALAQAMRKSALWPAGDDRSPETVANKLRDADKGKDVEWWTGTGRPLLPALADAVQEDEENLDERLQREPSAPGGEGTALWPFRMFPALRPIDLLNEDPFPGVPDEIVRSGGPKASRTWWMAPTGAGKTLVGRWLELRYGWTFLRAERWTDVDLPAQGRVFVELSSSADVSVETIEAIPQTVKICVASPNPPPTKPRDAGGTDRDGGVASSLLRARAEAGPEASPAGVHVVTLPPPHTWVAALVRWAAARVRHGGGFDVERVREMFRDEGLAALFETPGDLLGFLGMVDHVGLDWLRDTRRQAKDPLWWIRVWLKAALERPDRRRPAGIADLLGKRGPELLVQMEVERLRRGLDPSLSEPEWIDLVPRERAPDVDRDRLLAVLDEGGSDALTQVRAMLAPDGASVVTGLKATGALAEADAGRLLLRPAWVANAITNAAIERLYDDAPDGLGSLLLFSSTSESALRRLIDEVRAGETGRVEACVAETGSLSPERMASLDGAFRAVGLALAAGAEVPLALIRRTWDRQMAHVFPRFTNWPAVPILTVAAQDHWHGATATSAWFAAAFSTSRALTDAGVDVGRSALNPWKGLPEDASERDASAEALTNAASAFRADEDAEDDDEPLRLALYRLGGDLFDRLGVIRRQQSLLDLQGPDLLVALATGTKVEVNAQERQQLLRLHFGLAALEDACRRRNADVEDVLAWCWPTWATENGQWPPTAWLRRAGSRVRPEDAERVWKAAPAAAVSDEFCRHLGNWPDVWPWLTNDVWARWLAVWAARDGRWTEGADAFRFMPETLALNAVRDGLVDPWCHDIRRILWARMPEALVSLADDLAAVPARPHPKRPDSGGPILDIVYAVPDEHCRSLVERARTWSAAPSSYPGVGAWLRRWLIRVVEQRSPGWREAYELLTTVIADSAGPALPSKPAPAAVPRKRASEAKNPSATRRRRGAST